MKEQKVNAARSRALPILVALVLLTVDAEARSYRVEIDDGITPRMTPEQVCDAVFKGRRAPGPDSVAMRLVPGRKWGMSSFPQGRPDETYEPERIWVVRTGERSYILIDDSNGELLAVISGADLSPEVIPPRFDDVDGRP